MVRRIVPLLLLGAMMGLAGCLTGSEGGGFRVWSHHPASPVAMIERGSDDVYRLDNVSRNEAFAAQNQAAQDEWDTASQYVVDPGEEGVGRVDRRYVEGLAKRGELDMQGARAEVVIQELIDRCRGVEFFDMKNSAKSEIEGVVLTAKAGRLERDVVFPYLRAVFQMNGFDLVPVEVPFYGSGFRVVKLEGIAAR